VTPIAVAADMRPPALVDRSLSELAVALFVAVQRASAARDAAATFAYEHPSRLASLQVEEADKEVAALAEAHGLVKGLIPFEGILRENIEGVFTTRRALERTDLTVVDGGRP
jgi:hypothetical protein